MECNDRGGAVTAMTSVLLTALAAAATVAQTPSRAALVATIDSIALAPIRSGRVAGMSVAVVRGNDTLRMRGYGSADLELDVPTPDRAIYEIGSVTKQFTAAAILQLEAQGKLRLDADVTEYLPDYPTHGARIAVRHLLDHTSGIHGYTEIPGFLEMTKRRLSSDSIVATFKDLPLDFTPGEALSYSNSAYFLLGLVIEKVTGQSYAAYVQSRLFAPVGMADSRYCSNSTVVKRRAHGYDVDSTGLVRAGYLDHVWPYSAGSLCSTVGDLVAWTHALHHGRVLSPAAHQSMITPDTLNDGSRLRYAKGLMVGDVSGHRAIFHGGGINGFVSELRYYPESDLTIVVLINTTGPPGAGAIASAIADQLLPPRAPVPRALDAPTRLVGGEYRGVGRGSELVLTIARDTGGVTARVGNGQPRRLTYLGDLTFADGMTTYRFVRQGSVVVAVRRDALGVNSLLRRRN